jgi:hypothetical protein
MRSAPVQLAVVGHTNTGKTSLLRTLLRDSRFGEVADRPATTREVQGELLLADDQPVLALFDTPGLEDAGGLALWLDANTAGARDRTARIEQFLASDYDGGRYEQEAKVLRQLLRSDAALYVIDAREPVLDTHREELRLLADCGKPLMPLLNFVADGEAVAEVWRQQLARMGLHVLAEFDTVVYDAEAEHAVFDKLGLLLEPRRGALEALIAARQRDRDALIDAACRRIARLLLDAAGARRSVALDTQAAPAVQRLRDEVRGAEQVCVDDLLGMFRFELGAYRAPALPLEEGHWALDPFDPEVLRLLGIRLGSAAAVGGVAGLSIDALTGGLSLGAGAALGAGLGAAWGASGSLGRSLLDRWRGQRSLAVDETVLAVLAARQLELLRALLRRGHAATAPLASGLARGWPSAEVRSQVLRARARPEWSALNAGSARTAADIDARVDTLGAALGAVIGGR